jgi:hypothetical protein
MPGARRWSTSSWQEEMEIFDGTREASDRFLKWRINYPESFVLNIRGNSSMLHLARCGHFEFKENKKITFAPKRASMTKGEIVDWVKGQSGMGYRVCSDCKP